MSGIMAIVSLDGRPVPPELARAQLAAIAHRGEWEPRLWEGPGVALGHVNLPRTPEAEREVLPMADRSGRYRLTWDGRLDNRDELGAKLGYDAAERAGKTDAEYVLDSFLKWGDDCVHHLVGDWAVVIWDNEARRLFCAKDPLGWRQLYYAELEGLLLVGSEPQQLFAGGWLPKAVNEEYVARFLGDTMQEPGRTCYLGVSTLEGGTRAVWNNREAGVTSYWTRPRRLQRPVKRPEEATELFLSTFEVAMRAQLRTNRPISVSLSGGLDSSYVAAVATRLGGKVTAISGYAPTTTRMDEREFANLVIDRTGIDAIRINIDDCGSLSSKWLPPETFDDVHHPMQSAFMRKMAATASGAGIGVNFGGEGGDEWLSGDMAAAVYSLFHGQVRTAWRLSRRRPAHGRARWLARKALEESVPYTVQDAGRRLLGRASPHSSGVVPSVTGDPAASFMRTSVLRPDEREEKIQAFYQQTVGPTVWWRDRHGFAPAHIEHRNPFNDLRLVEALSSIPEPIKRWDGRRKYLLRAGLNQEGLPEIASRDDKAHYTELLERGVAEAEHARIAHAVDNLKRLDGVISVDAASREVAEWVRTRHYWWQTPWKVICVGMWLESLQAPQPAAPSGLLVRR